MWKAIKNFFSLIGACFKFIQESLGVLNEALDQVNKELEKVNQDMERERLKRERETLLRSLEKDKKLEEALERERHLRKLKEKLNRPSLPADHKP